MRKISHPFSGQFRPRRKTVFIALFAASAVAALAASHTWDGGGVNDFWNTALNWSLNVVPASGDDLRFAGAAPLANSNNFAPGTRTFGSITFAAIGYDIRGTEVWVGPIAVTHGAGLTRLRAPVNFPFPLDPTVHVPNQFAVLRFDSTFHASFSCSISNAGRVEITDLFVDGALSKRGTGLLTLEGPVNITQGIIHDGTVWANGSGGTFSLRPAGTLRGRGTIASIDATQGGTVHPGDSGLALLALTGSASLGHALTTFRVVLNDDSTPGVGYDALWTQQLSLGSGGSSAALDVVFGRNFLPLVGQAFRIINVNNPNPIVGTFAGLPEGAGFGVDNVQFSITYTGFSGNDVTLAIVDILPSGNTRVWDGGGANNYWTTAANWVGDVAPSSGDNLVFPTGAARLLNTNDLPANIIFNSISLTGGGYTLRGNQVELLTGLHASNPSGGNTVGLPLRLGADQTFTNSAPGGLIISGAINLNGNDLTFQSSGGTVSVSGTINGLGAIEKRGSGNVTFSAGNGYFGLTRISEGRLTVSNPNALGQSFSGTMVTNTGVLYLGGGITVVEPLILASTGGGLTGVLVNQENTNEWNGDITLSVDTRVGVFGAVGELTLSGAINGPGGLQKTGPRRLILSGPVDNSYAGATTVLEGELSLEKTGGHVAVPGSLTIGDGVGGPGADVVVVARGENIADMVPVTIQSSGQLTLLKGEEIGSLAGAGSVVIEENLSTFFIGHNNLSTTFTGPISGLGALVKAGTGTLTLNGPCTHWCSAVVGGSLVLNNAHSGFVNVWATIRGTGPIGAELNMAGGTVDAGTSPGQLSVLGSILVFSNCVFRFELNGPAPGTGYDQLVVGSGVSLSNAVLEVVPTVNFPVNTEFTIMNLTGSGKVTNTFAGLPEGTLFSAGGQNFQITYHGGDGNDVVLTRHTGIFMAMGMNHSLLGEAGLTPGPNGELLIGNLGSSGNDGVLIPLHDADGWRGRLQSPDPTTPGAQIAWKLRGTVKGVPSQMITSGRMEATGSELHFFADSSLIGATAHLVEVFRDGMLIESAVVPSTEEAWTMARDQAPLNFVLQDFLGDGRWHQVSSFSEPQRIILGAGSGLPIEDADMVRISPVLTAQLPSNAPPYSLELTAMNLPMFQIQDEALLYRPIVAKEGLPHRALGLARMEAHGNRFQLSNLGHPKDGVSIEVGEMDSGIGILTESISIQPEGTELTLTAMGRLVSGRLSSLGTAGLVSDGRQIAVQASFDAVGSPNALAEVFDGNTLAGIVPLTAGQSVMLGPAPSGNVPDIGAVGVVPPCLRPGFEAIVQAGLQPVPCFYFEFTGQATFTLPDGTQAVGDRIRFLTQNGIGRFGSLSSFDINAALLGSGELTIQREKLRYPAPEITGLSRQRVGAGEVVEIIGRGFGDDPNGLSAIFGSNCLGLTPGKILSASDTRLTVEIGPLLAGAAGGLPEISRGVGVKSRPRLTVAGVELLEEALVFTHGGPAGRGTQLLQAAPPGPGSGTWYFSGPPSNGVLCLTFTNNWPSNALVRIIARLVDQTTGGGSYDIGIPAAQFTGGGTLLDCAQGIADLLRAALEQQAGVTPNISLAQSAAGVKLTLALPAGNRIDCGFLAIHVHAPPSRPTIIDVQPRNGREGDLIEIFGSGFGFDPDDLCITVQDSVSARLIPLRALMAGDTYIKARLGFVPPDARAGPLVVKRGEGRVGSFRPADSNTVVRATAWVWHGREPAIAGPPFEPLPRTPPVGTTSFDSEPPSNGVVCVTLLGNWPDNALVNVTVRAHDSMGGPGSLALDAPATQLPGGGTTLECAQRIADIIRSAFAQQAGRDVGVRVDPVAGAPAVKLTIFLPNGGHIDRGFVRIAVFPPAPAPMITDAQPRSGRAGDRVIITGRDFGEHLENLLVYVQGGNGVLTLLPVLTVSPTQIVAQVGIVRPDAAGGQIIVRQGIGTRSFPQAAGITTHSASVDWQPTGTFGTGPSFNPVLTDPATCFHSVPPGDTNCPAGNVCLFLFDLNWPTSARVTIQYLFSSVPISPDPSQFPGNQKYAKLEIELPGGPGSLLACAGAICEFLRTQNLNCDLSASPDPIVIRLALTGMTVFGADPIYGFMSVCYQPAVFSGGVAHTALGFAALNQNAAGQLQVSNLGVEGEDGVGILLDQSEGMIWSMTLPSNRLTGALHFQTEGVTQGQKIIYSRIKLLLDESDISLTPDYRTAGALSYGLKLLSHGTVVHQRTSMMGMAALVHDAGLEFKFAHVEGPWNGGGWTPDEASPGTEAKPVELWLFPNEKLVELPDGQTFMADAVMTTPEAPQVQPEHISRHTILGEGLPGFTLQDTWLQMFGQPHQALGQATLVAQNGHLAVTDLGLSGSDGLAADFDALGEALGRTAVKGYQVSLSPLIIGNGAEFRIGARGLFNGTTRTYLGHAGLRKPGANAEVFADFSPIGATQIQVEIYRAGRRVGGAPAPGGGTVATLISSGAGLPNLNGAGKLPPLPFCFTLTFDGLATFVLPSGMRWLGDEIRLLASDATGVTEGLSTFEITAAGFDQITLLNATVLEEIRLRVEHVADRLRLAWPLSLSGYVLDETTNLSGRPIPWLPVPASVYQTNSPDIFVTLPLPSDNRFYRLRGP